MRLAMVRKKQSLLLSFVNNFNALQITCIVLVLISSACGISWWIKWYVFAVWVNSGMCWVRSDWIINSIAGFLRSRKLSMMVSDASGNSLCLNREAITVSIWSACKNRVFCSQSWLMLSIRSLNIGMFLLYNSWKKVKDWLFNGQIFLLFTMTLVAALNNWYPFVWVAKPLRYPMICDRSSSELSAFILSFKS